MPNTCPIASAPGLPLRPCNGLNVRECLGRAFEGREYQQDLRGLFNNGWQRDRPTTRCVGPQQTPTDFNTFAMAALASKGRKLPDTITDRAVNIALDRRAPGQKVTRFRQRRMSRR